ncbi:YiiX/YebB-like N1pC/P60 family cysteine hydrolase [Fibrella sp. WM1]|uniref:YiiX/YebB-like N1pC/P60 family cysteine hydrolase n=1 Tax=Fibrella musci TaxID=3242485 RepID=UPI0035213D90
MTLSRRPPRPSRRQSLHDEYRRYIAGHYAATPKAVPVISRVESGHFDTGVNVMLSYRHEVTYPAHDEYTVATAAEPPFVEYEVVGAAERYGSMPTANATGFYTADLSGLAEVEAFEAIAPTPVAKPAHAHDGSCCQECADAARNQPPHQQPAPQAAPPTPAVQSNKPGDVLAALSDMAQAASQTGDDADQQFFADMQAILSGAAQPEKTTTSSRTASTATYPAQATTPPQPLPTEADNPHAIFDRIAQSMTYANAYNLGSFDLAQRFDAFDREASVPPPAQPVARATPTPPTPRPQPTNWVEPSPTDFLRDLDLMTVAVPPVSKATSEPIPLDPGVGGRSIAPSALNPGDLIISTTRDDRISRAIRSVTGSEVSHVSIYVGDGPGGIPQIIHATEAGVEQWPLSDLLDGSTLAVAYRHPQMTAVNAAKVITFLNSALRTPHAFDYWGMIQAAPSQLLATYCDSLPGPLRTACLQHARQLRPGTDENNQFFCSELVFKALQAAQLSISTVQPSWSSPQEVVRLFFDGMLNYVGHLKTF